MKYMLLIYSPENSWTHEEWMHCTADSTAICHELAKKGQFHSAAPLHPVKTATCVRLRDSKRLVTAGPFAETIEQLGGYYIIDVPNLDEAISIASRLTPAKKGTVEIRPMLHLDGLPQEKQWSNDPVARKSTRYLMMCYDDEQYWNRVGQAAHRAAMAEAAKLAHSVDAKGQYLSASPLHPVSTATSVRVRDGKRIVTDGPFAETNEVMGGFYLVQTDNLDDAIEIAAHHPGARAGSVEIRAIYELSAIQPPDECEILSSRDLKFSREEVFQAFSNPERLARWWGPTGFTNTFRQFQFQNGGQWQFVMHGPNGIDYDNSSVFESIVAPERIVINHISAPHFHMTITLDALPGNHTRLAWRMRFETAKIREEIAKIVVDANEQNFDRLTTDLQTAKA